MACYLERYNLPSPTNLLFTCNARMDAEEKLYWRRFANSTDFYKELGKGIQRELFSIYRCANRIFDKTNYVGRYSHIPPRGEKLAQKGRWTDDEVKRLKEAVHTVTKTSPSDKQPIFHGIPWQPVAELVMTRNRIKCRKKWLDQLCWGTAADNTQGKHWTKRHDLKLITRLYNSGVMEECDVDWMELKSEYEINNNNYYSPQWPPQEMVKTKEGRA
ncbi:Homeobox protein Nkx-2.1 [Desmophyllum pertusum]|uniref:Homeobox protein Nkx-2.1 n=1 Tax=Desmophyllum pertusum TaxID=174260 RepID=A0A9W9Z765_9CNID|nr:Homeobox protein Nkx-2.1 [Desmophyllum pertusum]